ncbi:MAG TPA: alcohol dehydrogenase catalytic domain-containing protein [Nitrososphaeraceae archaeon]|nr:alcohol dehydrogenase catalytic domain-containing protein [Nitrososphaeraceae archaeon]
MKSVKIVSQGVIQVYEQDDTMLNFKSEGDILVKMKACGICGSDLEKIYGQYGMTSARLGHEPSGVVLAIGNKVKGIKIGDRVFVHHHVSCNSCHYCRHGNNTMCEYYQKSNIDPCGLSDKFIVPAWNVERGGVLRLPDRITYEQASLIEPLACCLRALHKIPFQKGDDLVIFGAGPAGIMLVTLAKLAGAGKIFVVDINHFRLEFSRRFISDAYFLNAETANYSKIIKAHTKSRGVDVSIVATSSLTALSNAFEITRKGGYIILFGVPSKDSQFPLEASKLYSNELSIIPSYAASELETNEALNLLAERKINLDFLITHKYTLEQSPNAVFCAHKAKDCMKVIITT